MNVKKKKSKVDHFVQVLIMLKNFSIFIKTKKKKRKTNFNTSKILLYRPTLTNRYFSITSNDFQRSVPVHRTSTPPCRVSTLYLTMSSTTRSRLPRRGRATRSWRQDLDPYFHLGAIKPQSNKNSERKRILFSSK